MTMQLEKEWERLAAALAAADDVEAIEEINKQVDVLTSKIIELYKGE